jgi:hypothetical protein
MYRYIHLPYGIWKGDWNSVWTQFTHLMECTLAVALVTMFVLYILSFSMYKIVQVKIAAL